MRQQQSIIGHLDWPLFIAYLLLVGMGLMTVYSVAFNEDHPNILDFSQKYGKQVVWIGVSFFLGLMVFLIDADIYRKFAIPIYLFTLVLLVIVLFMPPVNGARAWLGIGTMGIQPAEFSKIGTGLLLARFISEVNLKQQTLRTVFIANTIILVPMALILMQPDAGTFVVFTSFLFVMYREGITYDPLVLGMINSIPGVKLKQTWVGSHFIPILFVVVFLSLVTLLISNETLEYGFLPGVEIPGMYGVVMSLAIFCIVLLLLLRLVYSKRERKRALLVVAIGFILSSGIAFGVNYGFQGLKSHQKERIELFLGLKEDPDGEDYNRNRAMAAVGSGGLVGKGYKNASVSSVESNHVPESETDFIFCPFAEEWGFVGTIVLIVLYMFVLFRIIVIAERQRSKFNRVYAYAVGMILFYHFAVNIGMNIGFAPVIGIPLPFFSYGGSSMMSFSVMMFILLKLDSQRRDILQ
ncbi:MAG: rod shape-determining protein RodA [Crocinitomicaceae bacterium]|jgi:rod shape determining protein RodA|nr:rod shape-determining protein RodA [Crocinitomicaceae bacterium]MCF8433117.1 rod shape-determining protein RodA [Crocinitomicaceae bacterium]